VFVDQMVEANVGRPDLVELQSGQVVRSHCARADEQEYHAGRVEIRLKSGKILRKTADFFLGTFERPMSDAQMSEKYRKLASKTLSADKVAEIQTIVYDLERKTSVAHWPIFCAAISGKVFRCRSSRANCSDG